MGIIEIHSFMIEKMKLKGANLIIYAVIRQATIENGKFSGSLKYLSEVTGFSRINCCNCLKNLVDSGFISKSFRDNSARNIDYIALVV